MKREELMINDIVFDYTNSPVKVCAVGQDIIVKNSFGIGSLEPNELSPILLTKEILVKNGFQLENKIKDDCITYKCGNFHLFYYPDGTGLYSYNSQIVIGSVHQLQHLLRLIGIEKEIEL